ncbi:hypothetical protein D0Y65_031169 [Glycine soja]|uniref:Uncharacterized protein n=1 Tax=Glycine soja TaxID=3848 RepID=A0A445I6X7_GLYSO|nr:hypothetical protein D0Y65_031169 [Glycine soja]
MPGASGSSTLTAATVFQAVTKGFAMMLTSFKKSAIDCLNNWRFFGDRTKVRVEHTKQNNIRAKLENSASRSNSIELGPSEPFPSRSLLNFNIILSEQAVNILTIASNYELWKAGAMTLLLCFQVSRSTGISALPIIDSRISASTPLS